MKPLDAHGRPITYLRMSVTDRCNLRCRYCMPANGVQKLSHDDVLSFEAMYRIAAEAVALGITKIRITGGEPLVRKGVIDFVRQLSHIPNLNELTLTTNGLLLREVATDLKRAGLHRVNVSLDSLKEDTFSYITRGGSLRKALDGLAAIEEAGFAPAKLNMVVMRGINDDEVADLAALTLNSSRSVRFIEYMPTDLDPNWAARFVPASVIMDRLRAAFAISDVTNTEASSPAANFRINGALGTLGVIAPVSRHFCAQCNRIRITASGIAKGCLFEDGGVDLRPYLAHPQELRGVLRAVMYSKPAQHQGFFTPLKTYQPFSMAQIGG